MNAFLNQWSTRAMSQWPRRVGCATPLAVATPGTFAYLCQIHPDMRGTVEVVEALVAVIDWQRRRLLPGAAELVAHGVENVVAPLGTAMTTNQAELISRYAPRAVLLYDSDTAGLKATFRSADQLLRAGVEVLDHAIKALRNRRIEIKRNFRAPIIETVEPDDPGRPSIPISIV